jgi:hypothetical protein
MAKETVVQMPKRKATRDLTVRHVFPSSVAPGDLTHLEDVIAEAIYAEFRAWELRSPFAKSGTHRGGQG